MNTSKTARMIFAVCVGEYEGGVSLHTGKNSVNMQCGISELDIILKDVCPDKEVILTVSLSERDSHGCKQERVLRSITVPAHRGLYPHDIKVSNIRVSYPADLCCPRTCTEAPDLELVVCARYI